MWRLRYATHAARRAGVSAAPGTSVHSTESKAAAVERAPGAVVVIKSTVPVGFTVSLRERHSDARIAKILGGNFARVMGEVWGQTTGS